MKICILTQTAIDISDYYKSFFKDFDLFFVTFKQPNKNAVDFLPSSTWSEGRNRLWQAVKGKYDYYLFIDDDLEFNLSKFSYHPRLHYIYEKFIKSDIRNCYKLCDARDFFAEIEDTLSNHKPEVLSVRNLNNLHNQSLDKALLKKGFFSRRLGWFDAQFTLFSNYAAERVLPYDTTISGWASAQILIYLISFHVFKSKSIGLNKLGVNNSFHTGPYVPDYKSNLDCKKMIDKICEVTNKDYSDLFDENTNHVNLFYGKREILISGSSLEQETDYENSFSKHLAGLENLMIHNELKF